MRTLARLDWNHNLPNKSEILNFELNTSGPARYLMCTSLLNLFYYTFGGRASADLQTVELQTCFSTAMAMARGPRPRGAFCGVKCVCVALKVCHGNMHAKYANS